MCNKRIKPDSIHLADRENRHIAREVANRVQDRFSADRGRWVQVDARTRVFRPYHVKPES